MERCDDFGSDEPVSRDVATILGQERRRQALQLELQASELKSRLVQAQLSALKGQLQPHFLFNTLNAIMVLVRQEKGRQPRRCSPA